MPFEGLVTYLVDFLMKSFILFGVAIVYAERGGGWQPATSLAKKRLLPVISKEKSIPESRSDTYGWKCKANYCKFHDLSR